MPTKLVISGVTGRMGRALLRLLKDDGNFQLIGGIASERGSDPVVTETPATAAELVRAADVIIDFSSSDALRALLEQRKQELAGKALVIGTTGLPDDVQAMLAAASARCAVIAAANFSVGVNLLFALVEAAARVLPAETYDVEIVETHHRRKADAPSGTALAMGGAVAAGRGAQLDSLRKDGRSGQTGARSTGEVGFHALRAGDVIGEHHVHFIGALERLAFVHQAQDRSLFAQGALRAAQWIVGKPAGRYSMKDVLGLGTLS